MPVEKVTRRDIEQVYSNVVTTPKRGGGTLSAATAQSVRPTLSAMFQLAVADSRLGVSPVAFARVPKVDAVKIEPPFTADESTRLRDTVLARPGALAGSSRLFSERDRASRSPSPSDRSSTTEPLIIDGSVTRGPWKQGCAHPEACARTHCKTIACLHARPGAHPTPGAARTASGAGWCARGPGRPLSYGHIAPLSTSPSRPMRACRGGSGPTVPGSASDAGSGPRPAGPRPCRVKSLRSASVLWHMCPPIGAKSRQAGALEPADPRMTWQGERQALT